MNNRLLRREFDEWVCKVASDEVRQSESLKQAFWVAFVTGAMCLMRASSRAKKEGHDGYNAMSDLWDEFDECYRIEKDKHSVWYTDVTE